MKLTNDTVIPSELSPERREALVDELYAVQTEVFAGVDRNTFGRYVVHSKAEHTTIDIQRSPDGRAVGYLALHWYDRTLDGRPCTILRAEAGTVRAFRGLTKVASRFTRRALPRLLWNPLKTVYYLGAFVHPSSYRAFCRFAPEIWPNPSRETPPAILTLMCELADSFGLEVTDPESPLVREVGWITRDAEAERLWWQTTEQPDAAYFVRANPTYVRGTGLITLVPMGTRQVLPGLLRLVRGMLGKRMDGLKAAFQRISGLEDTLETEDIAHLLERQPLLSKLPPGLLRSLSEAARVQLVPRGRVLFRHHDPGDCMYLILSGSAFVVIQDDRGDELLLDQLGAGQIFGEQALLSGRPRTATIRAATTLRLVRVDRELFNELTERAPELLDALWGLFGQHAFLTHTTEVPRLAALSLSRRTQLFNSATGIATPRGEPISVQADMAFLLTGSIELEVGGARVSTQAPALLELPRPATIVASRGARLVRFDPALVEATRDLCGPPAGIESSR